MKSVRCFYNQVFTHWQHFLSFPITSIILSFSKRLPLVFEFCRSRILGEEKKIKDGRENLVKSLRKDFPFVVKVRPVCPRNLVSRQFFAILNNRKRVYEPEVSSRYFSCLADAAGENYRGHGSGRRIPRG